MIPEDLFQVGKYHPLLPSFLSPFFFFGGVSKGKARGKIAYKGGFWPQEFGELFTPIPSLPFPFGQRESRFILVPFIFIQDNK
jgi:hypothetical protein